VEQALAQVLVEQELALALAQELVALAQELVAPVKQSRACAFMHCVY
jgi:hypothetical protein